MASVMFDKMRTEGKDNEELAYYFQTNVDSTAPVSYTHLDVNKRQALNRGRNVLQVETELSNTRAYLEIQSMLHDGDFD